MSKPAITSKNLVVNIEGKQILNSLSLDFPSAKVIGLLGPSGAGKTTLIRSIVGLQKTTSEKFLVLGQTPGSTKLRQEVGYMSQDYDIYKDLSVLENLEYFASLLGVKNNDNSISRLIAEVDLGSQIHQIAGTLSGGQLTRVSLAVAILGQPKLIVLDEPTVGLDPILREKLWGYFHRLADKGHSIIVSSHVMDEARRCDLLVLMRNGDILASGTPQQLKTKTDKDNIEDAFISLIEDKS